MKIPPHYFLSEHLIYLKMQILKTIIKLLHSMVFSCLLQDLVVLVVSRGWRGEDCRRGNRMYWRNLDFRKQWSVGQIASTSNIFLFLPFFPHSIEHPILWIYLLCFINTKGPSLHLGVVFAQTAGDFSGLRPLQILSILLLKHRCFQEGWDESFH